MKTWQRPLDCPARIVFPWFIPVLYPVAIVAEGDEVRQFIRAAGGKRHDMVGFEIRNTAASVA
jgi:hypothetical protein